MNYADIQWSDPSKSGSFFTGEGGEQIWQPGGQTASYWNQDEQRLYFQSPGTSVYSGMNGGGGDGAGGSYEYNPSESYWAVDGINNATPSGKNMMGHHYTAYKNDGTVLNDGIVDWTGEDKGDVFRQFLTYVAVLGTAGAAAGAMAGAGAGYGAGAGAWEAGFTGTEALSGAAGTGASGAAGVGASSAGLSLADVTAGAKYVGKGMDINNMYNAYQDSGSGGSSGGNGGSGGSNMYGGDGGGSGGSSFNLGEIAAGGYDMYKQKQASDEMLNWLKSRTAITDNMYAEGSPEKMRMQQEMERKDAAAGRNSQYGTREVDLAAKIAQIKSAENTKMTLGIGKFMQDSYNRDASAHAGLAAALGKGGGGGGGGGIADSIINRFKTGGNTYNPSYGGPGTGDYGTTPTYGDNGGWPQVQENGGDWGPNPADINYQDAYSYPTPDYEVPTYGQDYFGDYEGWDSIFG